MNDPEKVKEIFLSCQDPIMQKQLAFMLGRHQHYLELDENDYDEIIEIMSNRYSSQKLD